MKKQILNYTFSAAAKQITFTDYASIRLDSILLITNVTDGILIYVFADPAKTGAVATNVLTLAYNTTGMSDSDKLMILYDDDAADLIKETTFTGRMGEVQDTPTQYTLLRRLKDLLTGIALAAGDFVIGRVKITDGTYVLGLTSGLHIPVEIHGSPSAGLYVTNPVGAAPMFKLGDGTNSATPVPANSAAAATDYIQRVQELAADGSKKAFVENIQAANAAVSTATKVQTVQNVDAAGNVLSAGATAITEYNITLTVVNTEYSQLLPAGTKGFSFFNRSGNATRYAFTTGKVATPTAPWFTLAADATFPPTGGIPLLFLAAKTVYFATEDAGDIIELIAYS